eukprot:CAMPEP_0114498860 /NCGR_PEP_ID=MMETSP0109-20121206/7104_1 /TAXON_ID=29199 /ORGANISM="Chlorarachnion reptans, Strain CCCM449" /LENGTH=1231 /DNA_ID=CAMNT_0001676379 /DNA_START=104 /DNA_END=3799 /DNA_ORIENTATION=+
MIRSGELLTARRRRKARANALTVLLLSLILIFVLNHTTPGKQGLKGNAKPRWTRQAPRSTRGPDKNVGWKNLGLCFSKLSLRPLQDALRGIRSLASSNAKETVTRRSKEIDDTEKINLNVSLRENSKLRRGHLSNGFTYTILPNKFPPGRFEAHLEMHVGSVEESEHEQGVAHIVEHVTFLGSHARAKLYGTGTESNAYTDFHHTVYHLNCPVRAVGRHLPTQTDMLPHALKALREIAFEAKMEDSRIDKERNAILSEISMMSTLDYRITTKEMEQLHRETILPKRFPIGKEDVVATASRSTVRDFYERFYHPSRADLFVVGAVDPDLAERQIIRTFQSVPRNRTQNFQQRLSTLSNSVNLNLKIQKPSVSLPDVLTSGLSIKKWNMTSNGLIMDSAPKSDTPPPLRGLGKQGNQWSVRPNVKHRFSREGVSTASKTINLTSKPSVFLHELITSFHLILCSKNPITSLSTVGDLKKYIILRLAVSGIVYRLNSRCKSNAPFGGVEFDHSDSASEGCSVTTVKILCEPEDWSSQVKLGLGEIQSIFEGGLSQQEFECIRDAFTIDAQQAAVQGDDMPSGDVIQGLMDADLLGHTFMADEDYSQLALRLAPLITLDEVNTYVRYLLEYLYSYGQPNAPVTAAVLACAPRRLGNSSSEEMAISRTVENLLRNEKRSRSAVTAENSQRQATFNELISPDRLSQIKQDTSPNWERPTDPEQGIARDVTGVEQRRLNNGMRVSFKRTGNLANHFTVRVVSPGGISRENQFKPGAVRAAVHMLSQGTSAGELSREDIDLFCMKKLLNVTVGLQHETLWWEVSAPVSSASSAFQLLHLMLTDTKLHEDDLGLVKRMMKSQFYSAHRSLESAPLETLFKALAFDDPRYHKPTPEMVDMITLDDIEDAIRDHLRNDELEIIVVGDFQMNETEQLILDYMGSIPAKGKFRKKESSGLKESRRVKSDLSRRNQHISISDSERRAIGYIAGSGPYRWGFSAERPSPFDDGTGVWMGGAFGNSFARKNAGAESVQAKINGTDGLIARRSHPAYVHSAISVFEKMLNTELFIMVRDTLSLTYHVQLDIGKAEHLPSNAWLLLVHSQVENIDRAMDACVDVLRRFRASDNQLEDAKRAVISSYQNSLSSDHFWLDLLSGSQSDDLPRKNLEAIADYETVVKSLTTADIHDVYAAFGFRGDALFKCIAVSEGEMEGEGHPTVDPMVSEMFEEERLTKEGGVSQKYAMK